MQKEISKTKIYVKYFSYPHCFQFFFSFCDKEIFYIERKNIMYIFCKGKMMLEMNTSVSHFIVRTELNGAMLFSKIFFFNITCCFQNS